MNEGDVLNTIRNIARIAVVAALVLAGPSAWAQLKIGFIGELSGPQGALGQDQYDAFMLVVERNGGKLGGAPVQILREDSQLKTEVGTQVADKLLDRDRVPIITGVTFSNIMMAIHKKIIEREVFLIGSNAGPSPIAGPQCSPYAFITSAQNDQRSATIGRYAAERGYKRLYAMAPNYQAGKDNLVGLKGTYQAPLLEEVYTPLNQLDFQAEIARIAAAKPDAAYVFYPGGLGVQFVRQWQQAGLRGKMPLLSISTVDGINLPAQKEAALGLVHGSFWGPDLDNASNKQFVEEFDKKYGRIPSEYAAAAYDSALLLDSALAKVKGNVTDKKAFMAALKAADFASVRGNFKFNNNNFPIQDFYAFEVVQDPKGRHTLKTIAKVIPNAQDPYHNQCAMK